MSGLGVSDISIDGFDPSLSVTGQIGVVIKKRFSIGFPMTTYGKEEGGVRDSIVPGLIDFGYYFLKPSDGPFLGIGIETASETITLQSTFGKVTGPEFVRKPAFFSPYP